MLYLLLFEQNIKWNKVCYHLLPIIYPPKPPHVYIYTYTCTDSVTHDSVIKIDAFYLHVSNNVLRDLMHEVGLKLLF